MGNLSRIHLDPFLYDSKTHQSIARGHFPCHLLDSQSVGKFVLTKSGTIPSQQCYRWLGNQQRDSPCQRLSLLPHIEKIKHGIIDRICGRVILHLQRVFRIRDPLT
jgi:hypothetical protein